MSELSVQLTVVVVGLSRIGEAMTGKRFPILSIGRREYIWSPRWIPWVIAEQAYVEYTRCGHDQSLERIAQRGGFSIDEIDKLLAGDYHGKFPTDPPEPFVRAGGGVICGCCGLQYRDHPSSPHYLAYDDKPFLRRLCSGILVKL